MLIFLHQSLSAFRLSLATTIQQRARDNNGITDALARIGLQAVGQAQPLVEIAFGSDHAGYKLKKVLIHHLEEKGIPVADFGCDSEDRTDYPYYAQEVAASVAFLVSGAGSYYTGQVLCPNGGDPIVGI